jgi:hypothetical protein
VVCHPSQQPQGRGLRRRVAGHVKFADRHSSGHPSRISEASATRASRRMRRSVLLRSRCNRAHPRTTTLHLKRRIGVSQGMFYEREPANQAIALHSFTVVTRRFGSGATSFPPRARKSCSRASISSMKCHGNTRKSSARALRLQRRSVSTYPPYISPIFPGCAPPRTESGCDPVQTLATACFLLWMRRTPKFPALLAVRCAATPAASRQSAAHARRIPGMRPG